ncbi:MULTISPECIES: fumarylacetoacetase [unclassified Nocardioides]|uniref:fumarylacetoacetase n=1 Tax=unclassified Nocardioides TaxID=2615069 RepID=UPI000700006C|nr:MULTISPECIES: fumarylacetoacetase [unclassified Nocardioides]KRA38903.1 fumarylacetoacetase [Nocardioides sp. Root614]KRA92863.1 fumarylacetoacetase [Nocardioides sp. Root682]
MNDLYGITNLPYGVYSVGDSAPRCATRFGDQVLDLALLLDDPVFAQPSLNAFMEQGKQRWDEVRARLIEKLVDPFPSFCAHSVDDVTMHLPFEVADYVDFYASEHHASNLGRLFRPDNPNPLLPNWKHLPVSYTGRAGSVVVSGTDIVRPCGQRLPAGAETPVFGPSVRLDIEAELGFVVGTGNPMGSSISTEDAADHIFGVALFNDWSARDIQAWEYVPLGPHLGKSFASTIAPWIVPLAALDAARVSTPTQAPSPLPYLAMGDAWGLEIDLEVEWNGDVVTRPPYASMYWSPAQMLAHLTVNGAPTRTGDLYASGTISGPDPDQVGSLIELGKGFLEDGDEVVLRASAPGINGTRIGFGEARGRITAARS